MADSPTRFSPPTENKWCGCESTSAHYTIGGYRRDLHRECRISEGLQPVEATPEALEEEESVTESDSDWVEPSRLREDDNNKKDTQDAIAKSDTDGVNPQKRKLEESPQDISCKKQKKSNTISIRVKVNDMTIDISVQGGECSQTIESI